MNNRGGPTKIGILIFALWPTLISLIFTIILFYFNKLHDNKDIFIGELSAIIGYSATASFFLLALPRNGYLKILDKRKHSLTYTFTLLIPAIIGIIQMFFLYLESMFEYKHIMAFISNFLFLSTIIQFFWSLLIIILIIIKIRKHDLKDK
jgi:hypothetical protein